jgi:hypothetical protein
MLKFVDLMYQSNLILLLITNKIFLSVIYSLDKLIVRSFLLKKLNKQIYITFKKTLLKI